MARAYFFFYYVPPGYSTSCVIRMPQLPLFLGQETHLWTSVGRSLVSILAEQNALVQWQSYNLRAGRATLKKSQECCFQVNFTSTPRWFSLGLGGPQHWFATTQLPLCPCPEGGRGATISRTGTHQVGFAYHWNFFGALHVFGFKRNVCTFQVEERLWRLSLLLKSR